MPQTDLIKIKNAVNNNKILDAKSYICDMFLYLCEAKRYIDIVIYDNAVRFKDYFFNNIQQSFFMKHTELKDKRQVQFYLNNLYDEVLERCMELETYIKEFSA